MDRKIISEKYKQWGYFEENIANIHRIFATLSNSEISRLIDFLIYQDEVTSNFFENEVI